jgi:MFS family permease
MASSFAALFLARMLVGVGEATLAPAAYSLIGDYFPRQRRARAMSLYSAGVLIGSGLAYMVGGGILPFAERAASTLHHFGIERAGWQIAFFAAGLPGVILPFVLLTVSEPARRERLQQATARTSAAQYLFANSRFYVTACCALGAMAVVNYGNFAWLPAVFQRVHGYTAAEFGYAFGLVLVILGPLGMFVGGVLVDRVRSRPAQQTALYLCAFALLLMLPASVLSPIVADTRLAWPLIAFEMFVVAIPLSVGPIALQLATPNEFRGVVMALYMFATNLIGLGLGPLVAAMLSDHAFQSERMIGVALGIQSAIFLPLAALPLLWLARNTRS